MNRRTPTTKNQVVCGMFHQPARIKAIPKPRPMLTARRVARKGSRDRLKMARRTRPPSRGYAGNRLKSPSHRFAQMMLCDRFAGLRYGSAQGCDCGIATPRNTAAIPVRAKFTNGPIAAIAVVRFQLTGNGG